MSQPCFWVRELRKNLVYAFGQEYVLAHFMDVRIQASSIYMASARPEVIEEDREQLLFSSIPCPRQKSHLTVIIFIFRTCAAMFYYYSG